MGFLSLKGMEKEGYDIENVSEKMLERCREEAAKEMDGKVMQVLEEYKLKEKLEELENIIQNETTKKAEDIYAIKAADRLPDDVIQGVAGKATSQYRQELQQMKEDLLKKLDSQKNEIENLRRPKTLFVS